MQPEILVLANRLPFPVDDGWKTRTFHVLRGLTRQGRVTLLSFDDGPQEARDQLQAALEGAVQVVTVPKPHAHSPARVLLGLLTRVPLHVWNTRSTRYRSALRELLVGRPPDLVVAELTFMADYFDELPAGTRTVVDTHNIDSLVLARYARTLSGVLRRWYAALTARKLRHFERVVFERADIVWVCSEPEAPLARSIAPAARVHVVPNGVDTRALAPLPAVTAAPNRILFFGRLDYEPNVDAVRHFVRDVLPHLLELEPEVECHVVGAGDTAPVRELAHGQRAVHVLGRVDDLRPVLAQARVVVVPLRMGGGTRLKILEALAAARPVVSTTLGAEGLAVTHGQHLLLADTSAEFARAVYTLLRDPALCARLGEHGRALVEERYDWRAVNEAAAATLGWSAPFSGARVHGVGS